MSDLDPHEAANETAADRRPSPPSREVNAVNAGGEDDIFAGLVEAVSS